ncbi:hypothetical protein IF1G_00243 [Cordyceps javanica]|uniref:Uncharacterized protein n=1 Tax=Cordyceps javanica TaxID=43265 RepID=A0A545VF15_9HYPO|nr:hypothetical protein IF1G_00243 [Cordyceps javanica]TQW11504.1 hypothetical protein IF2G_00235 [Cordyceps javanica]
MELAAEIPGEHAASSATSSPNSIIDRKRELRAIPGSFSHNLGRRGCGLPPRLDLSPRHGPSRSVRSIVAWIQSSSAAAGRRSSQLSAGDDGGGHGGGPLRSDTSSYKLHANLRESPSRRHRRGFDALDSSVDSDCPTFLEYQRYFARESLARCLDTPPPPPPPAKMDRPSAVLERGADAGKRVDSIRQQLWIPDEELESTASETSSVRTDEASAVLF